MLDAPRELDPQISALVGSLLQAEGWSLVVDTFLNCEDEYIRQLRLAPVGPYAQTAAVKLAHIEELRDIFRSATPSEYGDPFDARPHTTGNGPERQHPDQPELTPDDDDYDLGEFNPEG